MPFTLSRMARFSSLSISITGKGLLSPTASVGSAAEDLAADDLAHDFRRTAGDPADAGVDVGVRDLVLHHVAPAAVELQTLVGHLALQFAGQHLGHRGLHRIQLLLHGKLDTAVDEDP